MTKIDILSGFLGAGKTTLIKKLIAEAYQGEKLVLIENEFGEGCRCGSHRDEFRLYLLFPCWRFWYSIEEGNRGLCTRSCNHRAIRCW